MRRRIALATVVVVSLALSACDPGDFADFLDAIETTDLSSSSDPGVKAAGETAVEVLSIRQAEENLKRGVAERNLAAVQQASRLRPDDPKYPMYEAAILQGSEFDTDFSQRNSALNRALFLTAQQNPEMKGPELIRVSHEMHLNALRDVIRSGSEFEGRERMVAAYCKGITSIYPKQNTDRFPQDVALYLATEADFSLIPDCQTG